MGIDPLHQIQQETISGPTGQSGMKEKILLDIVHIIVDSGHAARCLTKNALTEFADQLAANLALELIKNQQFQRQTDCIDSDAVSFADGSDRNAFASSFSQSLVHQPVQCGSDGSAADG